jgi:2-polyprenyl-3-methyl-5-hydroxy-6-metoxy-1,4-benzoquinol methylase
MADDRYVPVFNWTLNELTPEGRAAFFTSIAPHLTSLCQPGDSVLDICCGTGGAAFLLEEHGALVTAIDSSPRMIELGRQEAARRGSRVRFIQADVLAGDLGAELYELCICLGNAVLDFPHAAMAGFRDRVSGTLKPGGTLAINHIDGVMSCMRHSTPREVVVQESPERIERCF